MENDDAQYKKELEEARQTGDLTVVAAVQAKWTVRGTIAGDSRFNGADLKNFEKIAEKADKLSPGEKLEFYLRLGAEVFKGKNGDGKNTREFLANLANSPRAIQRMGRWSAGMGQGAKTKVGAMAAISGVAGLTKLASMISKGAFTPGFGLSTPASPKPKSPNPNVIQTGSGLVVALLVSGSKNFADNAFPAALAALTNSNFPSKAAREMAMKEAAYSLDTMKFAGEATGKLFEGIGIGLAIVDISDKMSAVINSNLTPIEKVQLGEVLFWGSVGNVIGSLALGTKGPAGIAVAGGMGQAWDNTSKRMCMEWGVEGCD